MDTRPPPTAFMLPILVVTMVFAIACGCSIGQFALSAGVSPFLATGLSAGTTASLTVAVLNTLQEAVNDRHLASRPLLPMPRIGAALLVSGTVVIAMALFLSF